jgi:type III secretion system YseE family protein
MTLRMTDLEERLASADGPMVRAELKARLEQARLELRSKVAAGLPPHDYAQAVASMDAIEAAQAVLAAFPQPDMISSPSINSGRP